MKTTMNTLLLLKQHKLLRGSLATRLEKRNPCEYIQVVTSFDSYSVPEQKQFLTQFTEEEIAKSGWWSFLYAMLVLKDRFELGEPAIKRDDYMWGNYQLQVERFRDQRARRMRLYS